MGVGPGPSWSLQSPHLWMGTEKAPGEGIPTRAWGVYLVVLEGRVVGGAGRHHLHGGRLRGLDVEMRRPLEEETR